MTQLTIPDKLRIFNHDIDNWRYETDSQRVTWTRFAILVFTPWAWVYLFNGGQSWKSPFSCLEQVSKTEAERGCVKCSKSGITLWRPLVTDVRRKGGGVGVQQEGLLVPSKAKSGRTTCLELSAQRKITLLEHVLYCVISCYLKTNHKRQVYRDRR